MRPINNVVDASNYVMLELGQPTHPYDLSLLPGRGLSVRRANPGEIIETLDGVARTVGVRGRSLGDTGEDCLICDAEGTPVGIGGIMGGASSEIADSTHEVLLEAAYFTPMAIARTSKRLGLRTEASARFERGCDPWGIEPSVARFCELLGESVPGLEVADGILDVRGDVPEPFVVAVPVERVHRQIGVELSGEEIARLIGPIGFTVLEPGGDGVLEVMIPTNRPDVRFEPFGVDDVIEEIARTFGYSKVPRRTPTWPQPGGLTPLQRNRRLVKDVLCGLGASEGWTDSFVSQAQHDAVGLTGPAVRVSNPLDAEKPFLRRSLLPGLLGALSYNAGRRQGDIRLFEVGVVFSHPTRAHRAWSNAPAPAARRWRRCRGSESSWPRSSPASPTMPARRWSRGRSWPMPSTSAGSACCLRAMACPHCPACIPRVRPTWWRTTVMTAVWSSAPSAKSTRRSP
jgi:phenylalanyl-tRNA synthetase beta chain